ncbi:hypothetical protein CRG98_002416 [Punica granatum]|uniref:CCHC-type domain-containing protein n=1 Tax=Punica granatum TaxID=22663 RepID=A0A2I0LAL1_PUNGR|nr:hypothetical protein CRG98_002416 [Punica granatum]
MKALLVQQGLERALEGGRKLPVTLSLEERKTLMSKALSVIQLNLSNKVLREQKSMMSMWYLKQRLYQLKMSPETSISGHGNLFNQIVVDLANAEVSLNSKELQKKVMEHYGDNNKGLVEMGRLNKKGSHGQSKLRGRTSICWNCNEEDHLKRDCPRRRDKKCELSRDEVIAEERYKGKDILTAAGRKVFMAHGDTCDVVGVGEVRIKLYIGCEMLLGDDKQFPRLKKNLISLSALDKLHYKYRCQGGAVIISKGTLVVIKELLQKGLYVLQGMALTTAVECLAPGEKYLESLEEGGDLLRTDKIEGTCRG